MLGVESQLTYMSSYQPLERGIYFRGDATKWESEINDTETMITSWKDREHRGNLCDEILRELFSMSLLLCFLKPIKFAYHTKP